MSGSSTWRSKCPPSELSAVCSHEQWAEIYRRLIELITSHRSTLMFVNTRRLAERVAHHLRELLGEDVVASHHGSLSREIRQSAEQRLKDRRSCGRSSPPPRSRWASTSAISTWSARSVRPVRSPPFCSASAGPATRWARVPKGRLLPLTRDELLESLALVRAVQRGHLDAIEIPDAPLDILAQQIVAGVACEECDEDDLYRLMPPGVAVSRSAARGLRRDCTHAQRRRGAGHEARRLSASRRINGRLRARRGARLAAITSGGAIPETALYRVVAEPDETFVGTVDEDFAVESLAGDVFLLGNTSWRILYVRGGEVRVRDAEGAPPSIPFWLGEAPGGTPELSAELSALRSELAATVRRHDAQAQRMARPDDWLERECGASDFAARQALTYVETQLAAIGVVPTGEEIVFERFFDESGGMQLVIHAPLGARINRAWGLALRKRFCRSFDFELQAAADDDGIVLSLGPQHSVPIEELFKMLNAENVAAPAGAGAVGRADVSGPLAVERHPVAGRAAAARRQTRAAAHAAVPQRRSAGGRVSRNGRLPGESLTATSRFPTIRWCGRRCTTACTKRWTSTRWWRCSGACGGARCGSSAATRASRRRSAHELLNANPYAFLDGAPLEERRMRAVATRRTLSPDDMRDLAKLDPEAIAQVRREAWPLVRSADELHDALTNLVVDRRVGSRAVARLAATSWRLRGERRRVVADEARVLDRSRELADSTGGISRRDSRPAGEVARRARPRRAGCRGLRGAGAGANRTRRSDDRRGDWPSSWAFPNRWSPRRSKPSKVAGPCCAAISSREIRQCRATARPQRGRLAGAIGDCSRGFID